MAMCRKGEKFLSRRIEGNKGTEARMYRADSKSGEYSGLGCVVGMYTMRQNQKSKQDY